MILNHGMEILIGYWIIHGFVVRILHQSFIQLLIELEIIFKWIEETIEFMVTQEIRRNMKQLNLPFAEPNYDDEPLPDNVKYKLKRVDRSSPQTIIGIFIGLLSC